MCIRPGYTALIKVEIDFEIELKWENPPTCENFLATPLIYRKFLCVERDSFSEYASYLQIEGLCIVEVGVDKPSLNKAWGNFCRRIAVSFSSRTLSYK
ncbi:hypothetical protein NPIL_210951 [Nephila pilipes]|uniref:Uncharacterized protein n=1 Tax=Nephila pilipes TaxID=299642 RepID=A0A8X6JZQ9_NEPPI|nr:hypothetical protein NPIL_210951 [Nephila pilipes]